MSVTNVSYLHPQSTHKYPSVQLEFESESIAIVLIFNMICDDDVHFIVFIQSHAIQFAH